MIQGSRIHARWFVRGVGRAHHMPIGKRWFGRGVGRAHHMPIGELSNRDPVSEPARWFIRGVGFARKPPIMRVR